MSAVRCFKWGPPPWDKAARLAEYAEYRKYRHEKKAAKKEKKRRKLEAAATQGTYATHGETLSSEGPDETASVDPASVATAQAAAAEAEEAAATARAAAAAPGVPAELQLERITNERKAGEGSTVWDRQLALPGANVTAEPFICIW